MLVADFHGLVVILVNGSKRVAKQPHRDHHLSILVPDGLLLGELHDTGSLSVWALVDQDIPAQADLLDIYVVSNSALLAEATHDLPRHEPSS